MMFAKRSSLFALVVLAACGPATNPDPDPPVLPLAPASMQDVAVEVAADDIPFRTPIEEARLQVWIEGDVLHWEPAPGLVPDGYAIVGEVDGERRVLAEVTGTEWTIPADQDASGVQPLREGRVGRLYPVGSGISESQPLTRGPDLQTWLLRLHEPRAGVRHAETAWRVSGGEVRIAAEPPGLRGTATFELVAPGGSDRVTFRLAPAQVTATDGAGTALTVEATETGFAVVLPSAPPAESTTTVTLDYTLADLAGIAGDGEAGADADLLFFTPRVAAVPTLDGALGLGPVTLTVAHAPAWTAASSGERLVDADGTRFEPGAAAPANRTALVAGAYDVATSTAADVPIDVLALPSRDELPDLQGYADYLAQAASAYGDWGACVPERISVAGVSAGSGGLSTHGLIFVPNGTFDRARTRARSFFLAHELSHQWWGSTVRRAASLDLWLTEGLADYSAIRVARAIDGDDAAEALWDEDRAMLIDLMANGYGGQPGRDVPVRPSDAALLQDYVYYLKGAWVLRHLEGLVGTAAMDAALSAYLAAHAGGTAGTADFIGRVEDAAGSDLSWFWQQWLEGTGLPELRHAPWFDPEDPSDVVVTVTQVGDRPFEGSAWQLPVRLTVDGAEGWVCVDAGVQDVPSTQLDPAAQRLTACTP